MTKKPTDVYFYIQLSADKVDNYEFYHSSLISYCKNKKSLRLSGVIVEYCENNVNIEDRPQMQKLLSIVKNTKFLICFYDKLTLSQNTEEVIKFENQIKQLGGSTYFDMEVITERQRKALNKSNYMYS